MSEFLETSWSSQKWEGVTVLVTIFVTIFFTEVISDQAVRLAFSNLREAVPVFWRCV